MRWIRGFPIPDDWEWYTGTGTWLAAQARDGRLGFIAERPSFSPHSFSYFVKARCRCWHRLAWQGDFCTIRQQTTCQPVEARTAEGGPTLSTSGTFVICDDLVTYAAVGAIAGESGAAFERAGAGEPAQGADRLSAAVMATSLDGADVVAAVAMAVARGGALGAAGATGEIETLRRIAAGRSAPSYEGGASPLRKVEPRSAEHARILSALAVARGNRSRAAQNLGMTRRAFVEKLRLYGVCWKDR